MCLIAQWVPPPLQEMSDPSPPNKALRRRVLRLIAQWVARLQGCDRPAVYQTLMQTMGDRDRCMQVRGGRGEEGGGEAVRCVMCVCPRGVCGGGVTHTQQCLTGLCLHTIMHSLLRPSHRRFSSDP